MMIPSDTNNRHRRLRPVAFAAALGLVAVACGSDSSESASTTAPADIVPATTAAPEPELESVSTTEPEPTPATTEAAAEPAEQPELVWSVNFSEEQQKKISVVAAHPDGERLLVGADATYLVQSADGYLLDATVYWYPSVDDLDVSPDGELVGVGVGLGGVPLTTIDGENPDRFDALDGYPDSPGVRFHGGYNSNLSFSPDGVHLASGNRDGEIWIYDLDAVEQVATLSVDDPDYLSYVEYHPSGDLLAAVDFSCQVDFWDVPAGEVVERIEAGGSSCYHARPVEFSPDGTMVAVHVREDFVEFVRILAVDGFTPIVDLDMDIRNFGDVAFSPDSTMLATAAWRMPPSVWDVATGELQYSLDSGVEPDSGDGNYHPTTVVFTPDGGHVAAGYYNGVLELWRLPGAAALEVPEREVCEPLPLPGDVLFDTGSADLRAEADDALAILAEDLEVGFAEATLTFVGHTDSRGDESANQQLSLARAEAVSAWFESWAVDRGISGWAFAVEGRGEAELIVTDVNSDGEFLPGAGAINRRVEIQIDAPACA